MDALLDWFYEDINFSVKNKFRDHIINVTELSSSFFVLIKKFRGNILVEKQKFLFDNLKEITENLHKECASKSKELER